MTTQIAAIETSYDGYRFRSRLEARWAVFFNAAGIRYEYEKEGFNLSCGPYLPDFYLDKSRFKAYHKLNLWVEIKGDVPTSEEKEKCECFRSQTGQAVLLFHGLPGEFWGTLYCHDIGESSGGSSEWDVIFLSQNYELQIGVMNIGSHALFTDEFNEELPVIGMTSEGCYGDGRVFQWQDKAKAARFETF